MESKRRRDKSEVTLKQESSRAIKGQKKDPVTPTSKLSLSKDPAVMDPDRTTEKSETPGPPSPAPAPSPGPVTPGPEALSANEVTSKSSKETANDALNAEFVYYSAVLRCFAPTLTKEHDKVNTHLWMRKLFKPEYHSTILKPKRNKYLLYLTITMYNDEAFGIFKQEPPSGVLPEVANIKLEMELPPAAWELDKQWSETIEDLPDEIKQSTCYLHSGENSCPEAIPGIKSVYDSEFQFFLWLVKPYVALMADPEDKTMIACWIQLLCGIAPEEDDCVEMKELRNDYMQALIGYVHDLRVEGPFRLMPPAGPLPPLANLIDEYEGEGEDIRSAAGKEAEEFLALQPLPDNGAFAYINVTGELFGHIS